MSKGSTQRPIENKDAFDNNWEAIFGKKSKETEPTEENQDARESPKEL